MSDNRKGGAQELPSYDSGAPPDCSASTDAQLAHHDESFQREASNGDDDSPASVRPFRELSGNVFSYDNGQAKPPASQEMVLDQRKLVTGNLRHPVVFSVGDSSQGRREGTTFPHQEQGSGESEVLKNLRRAEAAYVKEMRHKDSRICLLETQLDEANTKEEELSRELEDMTEQKNHAEDQLEQTRKEYERVVKEKDQEISSLKKQIQDKEKTVEECRSQISAKELENQQMKDKHEIEINSLKKQLDCETKKYNEEVRELLDKKHDLELRVKDLQINEGNLRTELELARREAAVLRATLAEERLAKKDAECAEKDKKIQHLERLLSMNSLSSGASLSSQNSVDSPVKQGASD